ncbi:MAG: type II toxin-antitoxin system prevent-host-death family antitoxin [Actinomycetia bacterium]|nr:type II toxin-antitoxin system prevent-host-death family antitoxin [Actinomycetes bacterium]
MNSTSVPGNGSEPMPLSPIGVRELRNQVAAVVRRAGAGERMVVTVDGRPVAQLGPLSPDDGQVTLWDLAAGGLIEPPRRSGRHPSDRHPPDPAPIPVPADASADRLLEAARGR